MAHDVFISYASEDSQVAERVCRALEEQRIKCWIAPRDVPFGADYEEAIVDGITGSPLLVLILSAHSNASPHVKREIQNACAEGSPTQIIPLRIDAVAYSKALRYYLGSAQWLDASTPPLEAHLRRLVEHVRTRLARGGAPAGGTEGKVADAVPTTAGAGAVSNDALPIVSGTGDGRGMKGTGDGGTLQGTGDGRKKVPLAWIAAVGGVLLTVVVAAVVAYRATSRGGDEDRNGGGEFASVSPTQAPARPTPTAQQTPSSTPAATPSSSPAPTPARATPTPAASPRPTPPRNINFRLPINSVVGSVNSAIAEVPDWMIKAQIEKRMATHEQLSGVKVEVVGGVVTLNGTVPDADWWSTAQMMSKIRGVKDVRNNLKHN